MDQREKSKEKLGSMVDGMKWKTTMKNVNCKGLYYNMLKISNCIVLMYQMV